VPHAVLDVVAKDPEKEHVEGEVDKAAVHEHGGEAGEQNGDDAVGLPGLRADEVGRYERPTEQLVFAAQLESEDDDACGDDADIDVRR